jgi:hypothetical protein
MRTRLLFIVACALAALAPLLPKAAPGADDRNFSGWPTHFEGRALQPLELTRIELNFESDFPGRIGRFTDGQREIVIRWLTEPTRLLHPAADCLKGSGYLIRPLPLEIDNAGNRWGCLEAQRGDQTIRVRERIHDSAGNSWTDVSSWYWAALLGKTRGPWWAITVAERK